MGCTASKQKKLKSFNFLQPNRELYGITGRNETNNKPVESLCDGQKAKVSEGGDGERKARGKRYGSGR